MIHTLRHLAVSFIFVSLPLLSAHAQLSKSSPFLQKKNFIQWDKVGTNKATSSFGLALVKGECLESAQNLLPQWLAKNIKRSHGLSFSAKTARFSLNEVSQKQIELSLDNPCILGLSEDGVVVSNELNDPQFKDQLFYPYSHFEKFHDIFRSPAFKVFSPAIVAVVDSGISLNHPEFLGKLWVNGNGHFGYNFVEDSFNVEDDAGHGSHVAGLITANAGNRIGVVGVSQNVRLMVLKTQTPDGKGSVGDVADAIRFAADHGAEVINLSLSIANDNVTLKDAVDYALEKGVVLIASSGNDGIEITNTKFISPAGLAPTRAGLISVGSVDSESGELSFFSNYSSHFVEMVAPGSHGMIHILSTYKNERYFSTAGTSMSAPQVAGAAAQVVSYFKSYGTNYSPALIEELILTSARNNSGLTGQITGGRELDLRKLSQILLKKYHLSSDGGINE